MYIETYQYVTLTLNIGHNRNINVCFNMFKEQVNYGEKTKMRNKTKVLLLKRAINEENADNLQPVIDALEEEREHTKNLTLLMLMVLSVLLGWVIGVVTTQ